MFFFLELGGFSRRGWGCAKMPGSSYRFAKDVNVAKGINYLPPHPQSVL